MVAHRGFKFFKAAAYRGFKQIAGVDISLAHHIKFIGDADTIARKTASTLHTAGEYAALGSTLLGSDKLRDVGNGLTKMGQSIHNVRRGALENRVRHDFGQSTIIVEVDKERKYRQYGGCYANH